MDLKRGISFFVREMKPESGEQVLHHGFQTWNFVFFDREMKPESGEQVLHHGFETWNFVFFDREMKPESGEQVLHHGFQTWNFVFCQRDETREWRTGLTQWIRNVELHLSSLFRHIPTRS